MDEYKRLVSSALRLLGMRSYSTTEIRRKLSSKTKDKDLVEKAMTYLQDKALLDDLSFARAFIQSRLNRLKGPLVIKYELIKKGVPKDIITQTIKEAFSDSEQELRMAKDLLQRKVRKDDLSSFEFKKKAYATLKRKGFSDQIIRSVIDDRGTSE